MTTGDEAWLARHHEDALDPGVPIVDPHHHLWDHPGNRYLLDELRADTSSGHDVVATVFVECMTGYRPDGPPALRPVGETETVSALAEESARTEGPVIAGIVGFADLRLGNAVEEVLAAHVDAGGGRFRGIRHASAWDAHPDIRSSHTDPPPGLLSDPDFRSGFAALGRAGLSFDAWLYHPQLHELADLARTHPEVPVILDHMGGRLGIGPYAGQRAQVIEAWRASMEDVAACPNVSLKIGGMAMPLFGDDRRRRPEPPTSEELADEWGADIRWCIETFGAERCMFESNFPVDKRSVSYVVLWNTFTRITAGASAAERDELFRGTATRAYRLGEP